MILRAIAQKVKEQCRSYIPILYSSKYTSPIPLLFSKRVAHGAKEKYITKRLRLTVSPVNVTHITQQLFHRFPTLL